MRNLITFVMIAMTLSMGASASGFSIERAGTQIESSNGSSPDLGGFDFSLNSLLFALLSEPSEFVLESRKNITIAVYKKTRAAHLNFYTKINFHAMPRSNLKS